MKQYLLRRLETCSECDGAGRVQHPAWREFYATYHDREMSHKEMLIAFEALGWGAELRPRQSAYGAYIDLPDEGVYCSECEGKGIIDGLVNLEDALRELLQPGSALAVLAAEILATPTKGSDDVSMS